MDADSGRACPDNAKHILEHILLPDLATRSIISSTWLFPHIVPVLLKMSFSMFQALAASSSMAWLLVSLSVHPGCLLMMYRCTRAHSPHLPPWPGY
jgi:hypothetical protein